MARRYGSENASARPSALLADPLDKFKMLSPHRGRTTASRLKHLTAGKKFGKWQVAWVGYYSTDVSTPVPGYLKQSADVDAARTGSASGMRGPHHRAGRGASMTRMRQFLAMCSAVSF